MGYRKSVSHLWECDEKGPNCIGIYERYFGKINEWEEMPIVTNPPEGWAKIGATGILGIKYICPNCLKIEVFTRGFRLS